VKIVSFIKDSFQEFEGEQSLVLFSKGCNMKCSYCYNYDHITNGIESGSAINIISQNLNPLHTAVVFLGGEPTIWGNGLIEAAAFVKEKELKTKVYTNGLRADIITELINKKLLDAISLDFKTASEDYSKLTCSKISLFEYLMKLENIISLAIYNKISIEVRTTKYEGINLQAIKDFMKEKFPKVPHIITDDFRKGILKK
jgi:pyruvate formate lyase activating enzyme